MRKVRANDLIPGRNERNPVRIDGFRRPKFEKKNNYARAESGFCITYSERSQIRRRVLRPVLAETAREHVSRAMSETSASCSLITHVCLLVVVINLRLFQWRHHLKNQNCTRASATWISTKTKKQKKSLFRRSSFLSLLGFFCLITLFIVGDLSLPGRRFPFVRRRISPPTTHQSSHPRRRRHPTKTKRRVVPFCSVPFLTDRTQKNGRRQLIISLKNARRRFLPALTVVVIAFDSSQRRSLKNNLISLSAQKKKKESKRKC